MYHPGKMYNRPMSGRSTGTYKNLRDLQRDLRGLSSTPPNKKKIKCYDYHLPEDDNHHSHRRGNLKSYEIFIVGFQVPTAVVMKSSISSDITPCNPLLRQPRLIFNAIQSLISRKIELFEY
jgi:hypothetical protein